MKLTGPTRPSTERGYVDDGRRHDKTLNVHPDVVSALVALLFRPEMRGVGYSEFLDRAVQAANAEIDGQPTVARSVASLEPIVTVQPEEA